MGENAQRATLGGGCFWCLDAVYRELDGVEHVVSGYAGGHTEDPSYEAVCGGTTGHAEVVQVTYDPRVITYRELLEVFFTIHDPTTLNRQGADVGTQYRSIILYHNEAQQRTAAEIVHEFAEEQVFADPIVTEITAFERFHPAEDHHQDYYTRNPGQGYCRAVVAPKLSKFRADWTRRLRTNA